MSFQTLTEVDLETFSPLTLMMTSPVSRPEHSAGDPFGEKNVGVKLDCDSVVEEFLLQGIYKKSEPILTGLTNSVSKMGIHYRRIEVNSINGLGLYQ